jgi:microcystin-dependent protein
MGELKIISWNFAPQGWAFCNGQSLPINQNQALFSLLGTQYGGNGQTTFALPNLQGRTPIHMGQGHTIGEAGGEQFHTVNISEMPTHNHVVNATSANATTNSPSGNVPASNVAALYHLPASLAPLHAATVGNQGGSQAHENMQPYLVLNFCIALQGIFPSTN